MESYKSSFKNLQQQKLYQILYLSLHQHTWSLIVNECKSVCRTVSRKSEAWLAPNSTSSVALFVIWFKNLSSCRMVSGTKSWIRCCQWQSAGDYRILRSQQPEDLLRLLYWWSDAVAGGGEGIAHSWLCLHFYWTSAPKGISASFAILKNCFPKGIPIIVQQRISPTSAFPTAIGIPDTISQITFASRLTVPPPYMTSFPNGQKDSPANLKHCRPIGIPMIVMHHKQPAAIHASPLRNPPQINHNIFPRNLIICFLLSQFVWAVRTAGTNTL